MSGARPSSDEMFQTLKMNADAFRRAAMQNGPHAGMVTDIHTIESLAAHDFGLFPRPIAQPDRTTEAVKQAVAAERERCAKIVEAYSDDTDDYLAVTATMLAAKIRSGK